MRTVKQVSDLTGVSARTLHYYDEIGLLLPTETTEAGYRLYDDAALQTLQQILFFREFEIPLKGIKAVLDDPALDRKKILLMQREMLVARKERMERLIAGVDRALKGDEEMDFTVFTKTEIERMFDLMYTRMTDEMREAATEEFGGADKWKSHYMETMSSEHMQRTYAKVVEWFGGKDEYMDSLEHPISREVAESYRKREQAILRKLVSKRESDVDSFEVRETIGEYGFVMKQLMQVKDEKGIMLALAKSYREDRAKKATDEEYGDGAAEFFARAIEAFYQR